MLVSKLLNVSPYPVGYWATNAYDPAVFYTQDEWRNMHTQQNKLHIPSLAEEPMIYKYSF